MGDEELLLFSELIVVLAMKLSGRRIHRSTLHRWRSSGINGQRLDAVRIGGRWFSSMAAVSRLCKLDSTIASEPVLGTPSRRAAKAQDALVKEHGF